MLTAKGLESHRKQLASIAPASVEVAQLAVVYSAASFFPSTREQLKKRVGEPHKRSKWKAFILLCIGRRLSRGLLLSAQLKSRAAESLRVTRVELSDNQLRSSVRAQRVQLVIFDVSVHHENIEKSVQPTGLNHGTA